jgi:hypothetical protein
MRGRALVRGRTKINSPDPPLFTVRTAYPTEPLLTLFDPPIELASRRPRGQLHRDGRINFSPICCSQALHLAVAELHI